MGLELDTLKNNEYTTVIVNNTTGEVTQFCCITDLKIKVNLMGFDLRDKFSKDEIINFLYENVHIYDNLSEEVKLVEELFR